MALKHLQTLSTDQGDRIWTLAWNPTGTLLASSGADKIIRIWAQESKEGKWACSSKLADTHTKSVRRLCWSPCGQYLASASFDATICIWKRNIQDSSWSMSVQLEGHENEVKSVAWSHDGRFLASCGRDRTVWIWERAQDVDDSDERSDEDNNLWDCSDVKNDHTKDVKHVIWHPNHNILVSCSYDDSVKFFHLDDSEWKCYETITDHKSTVWSIEFSPTGEYLVTCSDDKSVKIWRNQNHDKLPQIHPRSWKCVSTLQGYHSRSIYDVSWCKNCNVIASCAGDNFIIIYKPSEDRNDEGNFACVTRCENAHSCDINTVVWNPKIAGLLASGSDDETIKLWNYSHEEKGRTPLPILDDILERLSQQFVTIESSMNKIDTITNEFKTILTDHSQFINIVSNLQMLQENVDLIDQDIRSVQKQFGLELGPSNQQQPVIVSTLSIDSDSDGGLVGDLSIDIHLRKTPALHRYHLHLDKSKFQLSVPKRVHKLFRVNNELFLIEKTGDLYRITPDGKSHFLLGHLSSLIDVKLITSPNKKEINYIISADRDEKIRISNYPETYRIERYAFGHEHHIRRLIIVDHERFLSIDQEDVACLWNLNKLKTFTDFDVLKPERIIPLTDKTNKKVRSS